MFFLIYLALKSYGAIYDQFMPEPCGRKNGLFDKIFFTKFVLTLVKKL